MTALSALLAAPALAADLPARMYTKAPPIVSPAYNWSGFYAGIHAGYGFGDNDDVSTVGQAPINVLNVAGGARPGSVGLDRDGFIGGGQIGYNWQGGPNWVFGMEADISYTDLRETRTVVTAPLAGPGSLANSFTSNMDYFGTVRGRLGYAWDRTMVYATGGLAYARIENSAAFFGTAGELQFVGGNRRTETGYTVGGGIEHAFAGNWTMKAEYLYYDLGSNTIGVNFVPGSGGGGTGYDSRFENDGHIVRAGLNYKFGGMAY
jgi:outer membrane immunogenic protein